jgi:glutathione S-transferase
MLTIWGRLNSHNVKKVAWFAEELGIDYVRHDMGGKFGFPDQYRALNPNLLVPTIEHEGLVFWESNSIVRYLAARFLEKGFWIDTPADRALAERWMDWQFSYAPVQLPAFLNLIRIAPADRDEQAIAQAAQETAALMKILDQALEKQPWLSGQSFGIGDVPMGVYAYSWFTLDIPKPTLRHVADWYRRLCDRPGYATQVMIPLS